MFDTFADDVSKKSLLTVTDVGFHFTGKAQPSNSIGFVDVDIFIEYSEPIQIKIILGNYNITANGVTIILRVKSKDKVAAIEYIQQRIREEAERTKLLEAKEDHAAVPETEQESASVQQQTAEGTEGKEDQKSFQFTPARVLKIFLIVFAFCTFGALVYNGFNFISVVYGYLYAILIVLGFALIINFGKLISKEKSKDSSKPKGKAKNALTLVFMMCLFGVSLYSLTLLNGLSDSGRSNSGKTCAYIENGRSVCSSPVASGSNFCSYHTGYLDSAYDALFGD